VDDVARRREYLRWLVIEKGRSPATIEAYGRDLAAFGDWLTTAGVTFDVLSTSELEEYLSSLRASHLSPASVNRALAAIRGLLAFLYDEGEIAINPASAVAVTRRRRTLPKPISEDLMVRVLEARRSDEDPALARRDQALLELLYGTGCRVSEAVGVQLQDIDFDEELIRVTGKGSKQRLVPLGGVLVDALRVYLSSDGRPSLVSPSSRSFLFLNARGGPLTRQGVDLIIRQRALAAGVPREMVSAHVFRHSCATHMLEHGADIRVVQELLGHVSIATTQLYTSVSTSVLRSSYEAAHPRAHG